MCGSRESDWIDPETERMYDHPHYTPVGLKCHGCAEIESYRNASFEGGPPPGVRVILFPDELVDRDGRILKEPRSKK